MTAPKYQELPIEDIELDVGNPRIALWLEHYRGEITRDHLSLALATSHSGDSESGSGTTYMSLKEAIRTSKGIIHPIIVNKKPDGKFLVIEGNTRVHIYEEFRKEGVPGNWDKIPAMIYEDLPTEKVDGIRLQAHLVGPRAWNAYSKAKYLNHLRNVEHMPLNQIVDLSGGNQREVLQYIQAYSDMETYYRPILEADDKFDIQRFSSFREFQQRSVQDAVANVGYTKIDFARWVKDGLLRRNEWVRYLPEILGNPRATEVFLRDGAAEAKKLLDVPTPDKALKDASLAQLARELIRRVDNIKFTEVESMRAHLDSPDVQILVHARDRMKDLCEEIVAPE